MHQLLERQDRLTLNQWKIIAAANLGDTSYRSRRYVNAARRPLSNWGENVLATQGGPKKRTG